YHSAETGTGNQSTYSCRKVRYSSIFHCPYRNPQDNSQTGYACKTIAGTGLKASGGCCRIITEQARNHYDYGPAFFALWEAGMGFPAGSPYHVGIGGSCIWRASRREAPTASQWTIRPFRPALHSSLFIHSVPGHLESSRKIQPVPARFVFLLIFPLLFPPTLSASSSCYLPHFMLKCGR
ncbi:hypothetical protein SAMN05216495_1298, partial [Acidaminococcus fermentans]